MTPQAVMITQREKAELVPVPPQKRLGPGEVRGTTIVTLISPGTELAYNYQGSSFPNRPGYSAVFRVDEVGTGVAGVEAGELRFCMGLHQSHQQVAVADSLPLPAGLPPERAAVARLVGVTMTTLVTTAARPGDIVLVTGAGPVGYLGAHIFAQAGYEVHVVEPDDRRREMVRRSGIAAVYPSVPSDDLALQRKVALVVECSGHEQAVLDACKIVRRRGEVVLVGVPWQRRTDLFAHDLLYLVFHNYVVLRSGWEWEIPRQSADFSPHSIWGNLALALRWIEQGRIPLDGLIAQHDPRDADSVYRGLLHGEAGALFHEFAWEASLAPDGRASEQRPS